MIAAVVGAVAAEFVPDDAPSFLVVLATVGGLVVGLVAEHVLGLALDRHAQRQAAAERFESLRARAPAGFAALLSPRHPEQAVPFLDRKEFLVDLLDWCTSSDQDDRPFRLVTGPGGVGKTRLADELLHRLKALDADWEYLFLSVEHSREVDAIGTLRTHAEDRPVLVVVDYAENRPGLREFLTKALDDGGRIRVLMLARTAGNWWDTLIAIPGSLGAVLTAGYSGVDLPDIDADPQEILDAAADAYAQVSGVAVPAVRLGRTGERRRVLDLTTAALVAVLGNMERPRSHDPEKGPGVEYGTTADVFDELLRHEASTYWAATAREAGVADRLTVAMRHALVAAVALVGVEDETATVALTRRVLETFVEDVQPDPVATARWLRKTYTPADESDRWVEPLTPDRVAEHLVVRVLTQDKNAARRVNALLDGLTTGQAVQAMTVLSRAATDPARSNDQQEAVRALADLLAQNLPDAPKAHAAVLAAVPSPSVRMAPTAALLASRYVDLLGDDEEELAASHARLAGALSDLGRPGDALPHERLVVQTYERLARTDSGRYEPHLADALSRLGRRLWEIGRPGDGLPLTQEAVQIYERLVQSNPDRFEPNLADALSHLGNRFADVGRPADGLPSLERAVRIRERLAQSNPDRFEPELARSLFGLGVRSWQLGRSDDGLPAAQRAVQIRERLARADPDRFEPDLARSLSHLGIWLMDLGRADDGLLATRRAVRLRERLAQSNPDRFEPELARSLTRLGGWLMDLDRPSEALAPVQQTVQIYERLAQTDPDQFEPELANSLSDLGVLFAQVGHPGEALTAWERATELLQACHDRGVPQVKEWLVVLLGLLAKEHTSRGNHDKAHGYESRSAALR